MKKYIFIFFLFCNGICSASSVENSGSWEDIKISLDNYLLSDSLGMNAQSTIFKSAPFVTNILRTCNVEDVHALFKIWVVANRLQTYRELESDAAIIAYQALINATKCKIQKITSDDNLFPAYGAPLNWSSIFFNMPKEIVSELEKLDNEYVSLRKELCDISIEKNKYIWRNCIGIKKYSELLSMLSTQEEISQLPAVSLPMYGDKRTISRYNTAVFVMKNSVLITALPNKNDVRYAIELYNTLPSDEKVCSNNDGYTTCYSKEDFLKDVGLTWPFKNIMEKREQIKEAGFDFSKLEGEELLIARMIAAGMIDEPDQPPSVEVAKYPPPLVPNWSEYFERDRYTAETGNVPPEPVTEPYAKVVKEQPKAVSKPEPLKESKEVVAESGMDQDKQLLIGIVAGAAVLLLLGFYALRRRKK